MTEKETDKVNDTETSTNTSNELPSVLYIRSSSKSGTVKM